LKGSKRSLVLRDISRIFPLLSGGSSNLRAVNDLRQERRLDEEANGS